MILVFDPASANPATTNLLAISAGLLASCLYATAANLTSEKLRGVSGLAITVGSLFYSTLYLFPFALLQRPEVMPQGAIWLSVLALGIFCTGLAYVLFYRLIGRIGSHRAVTVTFMVPLFSILWGSLFLAENITVFMVFGCMLVLSGVGMTTGKLPAVSTLFRAFAAGSAEKRVRISRD